MLSRSSPDEFPWEDESGAAPWRPSILGQCPIGRNAESAEGDAPDRGRRAGIHGQNCDRAHAALHRLRRNLNHVTISEIDVWGSSPRFAAWLSFNTNQRRTRYQAEEHDMFFEGNTDITATWTILGFVLLSMSFIG